MGNATVRGSKVEPGQAIKSANRWYTVEKIDISRDGRIREATVRDSKGGYRDASSSTYTRTTR